ncbi:hypothetical protein B0J13DRAFT_328479 [Dactylonectria estremocensis]|uniref:Uncharacterized protein n=1 Tax=Dactylonectria estremocensis TaxID=1079267 RepID=A0A9P9J1Y1_9HYPO|nr:hypothetical protein B0J13DRAFT_328479 [Dactylonectria estremocensis]
MAVVDVFVCVLSVHPRVFVQGLTSLLGVFFAFFCVRFGCTAGDHNTLLPVWFGLGSFSAWETRVTHTPYRIPLVNSVLLMARYASSACMLHRLAA